jgi:ferric-dicitrate binding protein FerR (iron transport regulator)
MRPIDGAAEQAGRESRQRRVSTKALMLVVIGLAVSACVLFTIVLVVSLRPPAEEPVSAAEADLTAREREVQRHRLSEVVSVGVDEHVAVVAGDEVHIDERGRALLRFHDRLLVELFRDTEVQLSDVELEPGGSVFVRLRQAFGHTRTSVESEAEARVEVETDHATIRAMGTEFLVWHGEALTCMVTLEGEAEVEAQGETIVVQAGEATYILADEAPQPAICAKMEEVNSWVDRKRGTEEMETLGALVRGWPQEPCQ